MKLSFFFVLALAYAISGCAGSFEEAKVAGRKPGLVGAAPTLPTAECRDLDSARTNWDASEKVGLFLAGGSGLAEIPWGHDETARAVLIGGVVVSGAWAAFSLAEKNGFDNAWVRECSSP